VNAGFRLAGTVTQYVPGTGESFEDLQYVLHSRRKPTAPPTERSSEGRVVGWIQTPPRCPESSTSAIEPAGGLQTHSAGAVFESRQDCAMLPAGPVLGRASGPLP
jgi:hypothetical protein